MPLNTATLSIMEYGDRETAKMSSVTFNPGGITDINYAAKANAFDALKTATAAIILGEIRQTALASVTPQSNAEVTDKNAQRETKWLVSYRDDQAELAAGVPNPGYLNNYWVTIPTADRSQLATGKETADFVAAGVMKDFVDAFEPFHESPTSGADNHVTEIRHVGRSY